MSGIFAKTICAKKENERGFSLMEVIVAIVVIGIVVPSVMIPFSQLKNTKTPEYYIQMAYLAQRQMEAIASKAYSNMPSRGSYNCTNFQSEIGNDVDLDCSNASYTFAWDVYYVDADNLETNKTSSNTFGRKVRLTITRNDGAVSAQEFYTLFGN